ncbi:TlpA family protein disulfide reductase [Polaribacter uvawellassae]|uniref:TlpA family protein disulfide reductase n=1 Tax=Polaribacter uvawellassae TaxID=3133495 RepID=UPI00321B4E65
MNRFLKYCFSLVALILIGSCTTSNKENLTYFGGKIIHPKTDFVLLFQNDKLIDSLFLDKEDKFIGSFKDFNEGFYYFIHGNENQYIYIEPKDSISIRLNTWDFDESLVFSGFGAEKNNILIDCFLDNEKERYNHRIYSFYGLEPSDFKAKIDSLLHLRQVKIDDFKARQTELPENYSKILEIVAKYPIYNRFERYPAKYRDINKTDGFPKLDTDFYSYRNNIDLNNSDLMYLRSYTQYIVNRFYNNVYAKGLSNKSNEFTVALLNTIDESITSEKLKNTFLRQMVVNDFLDKSTCSINKEAFYTYFKLSTDIEDKKEIQRLINDVKSLHSGSLLPAFDVLDFTNAKHNIKKLTKNKNSVIYLWNPNYISGEYLSSRINYLSKEFPKLNFIGVKISSSSANEIPIKGIDIKQQFFIDSESEANEFLTSQLPRVLLLNKKGKIVNGYASISSSRIHKQLKTLQKD